MSAPTRGKQSEEERATIRNAAPRRGPGGGGPFGGMGMPAEKSLNFGPSAKRLFSRLHPESLGVAMVLALAVLSVTFSVLGPKILGRATDIIFDGVVGKQLPVGLTKEQVIAAATARGDNKFAAMLSGMDVIPGSGIDFTALAHVLMTVLVVYVAASILSYAQGFLLNGIV